MEENTNLKEDNPNEELLTLTVSIDHQFGGKQRVDKWLLSQTSLTRSRIQRLLNQNKIMLQGGVVCKKNDKLKENDVLKIFLGNSNPLDIKPVDFPLEIVYQDEYLAVINKQAGMAVHPGEGEDNSLKVTLIHALLHQFKKEGLSSGENPQRPGIVHRLDKDTAGLLMICKNDLVHARMKEAFQNRISTLEKHYCALVLGRVKSEHGFIDRPIMRHPKNKQGHKMAVCSEGDPGAKSALTEYTVARVWQVDQNRFYTLLHVKLHTGRTHQIRVHLSSIHHQIVGDPFYSSKHTQHGVPYLLLVSKRLSFEHPITAEKIALDVEYPAYFSKYIEELDLKSKTFHTNAKIKKENHSTL